MSEANRWHRSLTFDIKALTQVNPHAAQAFVHRAIKDFHALVLREYELARLDGQPITTDPILEPL